MMTDQEVEEMTYDCLINLTLKEFENIEQVKKKRIIILAKKLERLGTPMEMICQKISRDLQGLVSSSYVRLCLGDEYKNKRKVKELTTSQSRESIRANDSKKVLLCTANNGTQEKHVDEHESHLQTGNPTIESLQNQIRNLEQERDYFARKLEEKSPDFQKLWEEISQLKEIERERVTHGDFTSAASSSTANELQQEVNRLQRKINEQEILLATNLFEADLELKEQIFPLLITIDRVEGKAKVVIDTAKIEAQNIDVFPPS